MSLYLPDVVRFLALCGAGATLFWLADIGMAHRRFPTKRFPNRVIWYMAVSYGLLVGLVSSYVVGNFGESLRPDALILLASLCLVATFLYRLTKEFHR